MKGLLERSNGIYAKEGDVDTTLALIAVAALLISAVLTLIIRRVATAHGIVDKPNSRSSHVRPTVRGGGLAIAVSVSLAAMALRTYGIIGNSLLWVLLLAGGGIAAVGFIDDRKSLSVRPRMVAHVLAAVFAMFALGGMPRVVWGEHLLDLGVAGEFLGVLAIVWMLNLFNFMDGIDGIAGSEALFVTLAGAFLGSLNGAPSPAGAIALVLGGASLGFLIWNWPPAKIFMGDVGSGYLGFVIGVIILQSAHERPEMLYVWVILNGAFIVDATTTLLCRLMRGERIQNAHRSHAYQLMARRFESHLMVTCALWVINLAWLLPCAVYCRSHPGQSREILLIALLPLALLVLAARAGAKIGNGASGRR